jgi:hypothetical protein
MTLYKGFSLHNTNHELASDKRKFTCKMYWVERKVFAFIKRKVNHFFEYNYNI